MPFDLVLMVGTCKYKALILQLSYLAVCKFKGNAVCFDLCGFRWWYVEWSPPSQRHRFDSRQRRELSDTIVTIVMEAILQYLEVAFTFPEMAVWLTPCIIQIIQISNLSHFIMKSGECPCHVDMWTSIVYQPARKVDKAKRHRSPLTGSRAMMCIAGIPQIFYSICFLSWYSLESLLRFPNIAWLGWQMNKQPLVTNSSNYKMALCNKSHV